jgi:hypothetical protein
MPLAPTSLPKIDTTVMGASSNSYVDLNFAADYFANHMSSVKRDGWLGLSDEQATMALLSAAGDVESLKFVEPEMDYALLPHLDPVTLTYRNVSDAVTKWNPLQRLQFPRNIDIDYTADSVPYIPIYVQMAQCEQAWYRCTIDTSNLISQAQGVRHESFSADGLSLNTIFTGQGHMFAPETTQFLRQFFLPKNRRFQRA